MPKLYVSSLSTGEISITSNFKRGCRACVPGKTQWLLLSVFVLLCQSVFSQQAPSINYTTKNYTFTKGGEISGFQPPANSGSAIPSTVRGNIIEAIGIGEYDADRIAKSGDGNLFSLLLEKGTIDKVDLTSRLVQHVVSNRDQPWSIVKDSKGNVYWSETGSYKIIANPNQRDESSWVNYALDMGGLILPGKVGSGLGGINTVREMFSLVTGGNDLVRTISGQAEPPPYVLQFSGKIYKLAPGASVPEVFVSDIQMPTGLAIDKDDNLYVSCFTAKFKVEGGVQFGVGGMVEKIDDYEKTYNAKIVKIAPNKAIANIGAWKEIDYPVSLGVDAQENLFVMYYTDNFTKNKITKISKYPNGASSGDTYQTAQVLIEQTTLYQDMAVDGPGSIYLSDFYSDKIYVLPPSASQLSVFSDKIVAPKALYIDLSSNQIWVKDGKFTNTGSIKKVNLYGYNISPILPEGLFLTGEGKIAGTPKVTSAPRTYTITGSNTSGFSKDQITISVNGILPPQLSYTNSTFSFPVTTEITPIPAPRNTGGVFSQQKGPVKVEKLYDGNSRIDNFEFDAEGNRYFTESDLGRIIKVSSSGQTSVLLSGLNNPVDIAIDRNSGYFYFSERGANKVKLLYPGFNTSIDLIGVGTPAGLAIDDSGFLYVLNQGSGVIVKYDPRTNVLTDNFVTGLVQPYNLSIYQNTLYVKNIFGEIKTIPLNNPASKNTLATVENSWGMAIDDFGNIYVSGYQGVKKIPAGTNTPQPFPTSIEADYVIGIAADPNNNLYFSAGSADKQNVYKMISGGYTVSPELPAGLVLNDNGTISGTPTIVSASKDYIIKAANIRGEGTATIKIAIPNVPTTNLQYATPNTFYRGRAITALTPQVSGGVPDSYSVSPSLPAGLSLEASSGKITGTPSATQAATNYIITANNSLGSKSATLSIVITEEPPSNLQYASTSFSLLKDKEIGLITPTYNGGSGMSFSISPSLPSGLVINPSTGVVSGTPTAITENKPYTVTATNPGGSIQKSFSLSVRLDPPSNLRYVFTNNVLMTNLPIGNVSLTYDGSGARYFTISPSLPAGLSFDTSTGIISGMPSALTQVINYTVTAVNDAGSTSTTFPLEVVDTPVPDISYANANYQFTKGVKITAIPAPVNAGHAFPQQLISDTTFQDWSGTMPQPSGVATDVRNGNTYVAFFKYGHCVLKKLDQADGTFENIGTTPTMEVPMHDLAVDKNGNIYASSGRHIFKWDEGNQWSYVFVNDLNDAKGLYIDGNNDLYVAEYGSGRVLKYANCIASAKSVVLSGLTAGATPTHPESRPHDIVVDSLKNIYVLKTGYPSSGNNLFTVLDKYLASGAYSREMFREVNECRYMTMDRRGNIYITSMRFSRIAVINGYTNSVKEYVGPSLGAARLPRGISLDADQNLYYAIDAGEDSALGLFRQFGYSTAGLPEGLRLNGDGTITGTPTKLQNKTAYTVTANSFYGKSTASLNITVADVVPAFYYPSVEYIWTKGGSSLNVTPVSTGGTITSYQHSPSKLPDGISFDPTTGTFSGTATKLQDTTSTYTVSAKNSGGTSSITIHFRVVDKAPENLNYPAANIFLVNQSFAPLSPTVSGGPVTRYSVSPALPLGVDLDSQTGLISGRPVAVKSASNYTIKAENSGGAVTKVISIAINDVAPVIAYVSEDNFKFKKGQPIAPISPPANSGGPVDTYSISGLPAGLNLNPDGSISGTPTQRTESIAYRLIANGQWGKDTTYLNIEIISLPPDSIKYNSPVTLVKGKPMQNLSPIFTTSGGDPVTKFSVSPQLPAGLTINSSTGVISGTPADIMATVGQLYYVYAENGAGRTHAPVAFIVKDLPPAISYNAENVYTRNHDVVLSVSSSGGIVTKYSIAPALPEGLTLDSITGSIYGKPTALSVKTKYTVTAMNYGNPEATREIYLTIIDEKPVISYPSPHSFTRNALISPVNIKSTGGAVVTYSVSPALPTGLSLNTSTGVISGTPTVSTVIKDYVVTGQNTGGTDTAVINISVKNAKPIIEYTPTNIFTKGIKITDLEVVSTGGDQITYSISPTLPQGLSFNTQTGLISGTATDTTKRIDYKVTATNDGGSSVAMFSIKVNDKAPGDLTYQSPGSYYVNYAITDLVPVVQSGGGAIVRFSISPALPAGLSFNTSTGVVSGKPAAELMETSYTVTAHNSGGTSQGDFKISVLSLSATISKTDVTCNGGTNGSATVTVTGGKAPFRYSWSPGGGTGVTASDLSAGTYKVTVTDANNSSTEQSVVITQPAALTAAITKNDVSQNGGNDGSATVAVSGGTGNYRYLWAPSGGTGAKATALQEGMYTVTITDASNCTITESVFIDAPPSAPLNLLTSAGNKQNVLTWDANTETDLKAYKVYGGTSANPTALLETVTAPAKTYTHTGLTNGTSYYYRITAVDEAGNESAYSTEKSVTPQGPQTISFAALPAKIYGDADFDAGAIASSGLKVTYSSDNAAVATIVDGKIHIIGAGAATIRASQEGNQTWLAAADQTQQLKVEKKALTVTATGKNKIYDGNEVSSVVLSDDRISGDDLTTAYTKAFFDDKNVSRGKRVSVEGITITGKDADNYTVNTTVSTTADITARALTARASAVSKEYDGTAKAAVGFEAFSAEDGRVGNDDVSIGYTSAAYDNKNAGTNKAITITGLALTGTEKDNYLLNSFSTTGAITQKALVIAAAGISKEYDGNAAASVNLSDDRVSGDVLTTAYLTATYDNKNAGTGKPVSVTDISISGKDAANYTANTTADAKADITAKVLTVTAAGVNKVYDGNTNAEVNLSDNRVSGDKLSPAYATARFDNKNVGTDKTVSVTGITISGTDAGNYTINTSASAKANITAKALTITADNKEKYEGLENPSLTVNYDGFVNGEDHTVLSIQPAVSTTATTASLRGNYPITVSGAQALNYDISYAEGILTIKPGAPTSLSIAASTLYENRPEGTPAGTFSSTSNSPTARFTYSLVPGAGDTDNSLFTINGGQLQTVVSLDYEAQQEYKIRVRSTTQYDLSLDETFTIRLNDVNEAPTLDAIADQVICYTDTRQEVILTGITAGPEAGQSTTSAVSSDNTSLLAELNISNNRLRYRAANGQSGTAVITVRVQDNGGISNEGTDETIRTFTITINPLPVISISSDKENSLSKGETAVLTATSNDGTHYSWATASGIITGQNDAILKVRPLETTTYTVTVTNAKGCQSVDSYTLTVKDDYQALRAENFFTPNGDGLNDTWVVENLDAYPHHTLTIVDRAGKVVYQTKDYKNDWGGTLQGAVLDEGTYYYFFQFDQPGVAPKKGFITIVKQGR